jgi:hypothetical protein|tara:strand:+ start:7477 stop:7914 length:438 start_codon:yes stop_codon:yes gene_type:complete
MNINDIKLMILKDSHFLKDEVNIDTASLSVPELSGKYHQLISEETMSLRILKKEYDVLYRDRWIFYSGKADPEEYDKEEFNLKILKQDIDKFLNADEQLNTQKDKVTLQESKINLLTEFTKSIMSLSFNIGNAIKWKKFLSGELG